MRTDLALDILKITLLFLLYLFFARVLWAVWQEVRTDRRVVASHRVTEHAETRPASRPAQPKPGPTSAARSKSAQTSARSKGSKRSGGRREAVVRVIILEPKARRGATYALSGPPITIGRDAGCTVQIDGDTFVSQHHARVYVAEGQAMVEDLGSTNGSFHNGNRLHGSALLHPGDRIQVGYTVLEAQ